MWSKIRIDDSAGDGVIEIYPLAKMEGDGTAADLAHNILIIMGSVFKWEKDAPKRADPKVEIFVSAAGNLTPAKAKRYQEGIGVAIKISETWLEIRNKKNLSGMQKWAKLLRKQLSLPTIL